jgi:hypothetical protein
MATSGTENLAVLIDADNAQASIIQALLAEVFRYGTASIKRAYGDWTTPNLRSWKDVLHKLMCCIDYGRRHECTFLCAPQSIPGCTRVGTLGSSVRQR